MLKYDSPEAKTMIQSICQAADAGEYDTREKFMAMLEQNPHIAAQGYNAYGKIFYWNKASCELYGYSEAAAVNQELFELILPPEFRQFARDLISTAQKTGKTPEAGPCDLVRRGGELVTVYSGHVMFNWDSDTTSEFYCVDVAISGQPD